MAASIWITIFKTIANLGEYHAFVFCMTALVLMVVFSHLIGPWNKSLISLYTKKKEKQIDIEMQDLENKTLQSAQTQSQSALQVIYIFCEVLRPHSL